MYKIIITILIIALILYYLLCFLELFKVIKFTTKGVTLTKLFIPFYYLFKN